MTTEIIVYEQHQARQHKYTVHTYWVAQKCWNVH